MSKNVKVAITQHEPVWLDLQGTVAKTCALIKEAAAGGAKLIAFPEMWVPGYPAWIWSRPVDFELGTRYVDNSLTVDSAEMRKICSAAQENAISVALGFSERDGDSLYISQALISEEGKITSKRRKMKPTHMERTIFGDATTDCLSDVVDTKDVGKVGCLSCWEHIQPLLKYHMIAQKEQIHVAAWPPLDGFVDGSPGFYSMSAEGCLNLSQSYAMESQAFVLHCTSALSEKGTELMGTKGAPIMGTAIAGSSALIGPDGRVLSAPNSEPETLLFAEIDLGLVTKTKTLADASGHYSRPDLLWLGVDVGPKKIVRSTKTT
ncbi:carbon-nitrogen hydrolase [Pseudovirgaria hyperparasitica]|uniref:nitrilase n=1 Tax=Pseudovirgaria hyperparasitica TaxID=470096 RepID=A0A6A6WGT3_9PEZI|nr:carbon-nitrogen hydrolase [Pseudovirgaria hyperparasitica]KAF2760361.1 carbon-nitrogen hydrolase [Pseudovirgaria hyperparasitica]